jgi:putative addiction module component (TIGR02574 family)
LPQHNGIGFRVLKCTFWTDQTRAGILKTRPEVIMPQRETLLKEALQLSEDERILLADALLSSVDEAITPEKAQVFLRRQAELKKNPKIGIAWDQIKAELRN